MRGILLTVLVIVFAGVLFFIIKSPGTVAPYVTQQKTFDLVVQNRKLVSGSSTLSVHEGDTVTINITVDENEELHLHGYDIHTDLEKGKQGSLSFTASSTGRFPYELEHSSTEIGALEVQP